MFSISNNIINVTRGDSFSIPLFINQGTDLKPVRYILNDEDEIYLAITEPNQIFENAIIGKKYTKANLNSHGDIEIDIDHEDTRCLYPGKYFYQVKGRLYDHIKQKYVVNTIIQKTEFWVEE